MTPVCGVAESGRVKRIFWVDLAIQGQTPELEEGTALRSVENPLLDLDGSPDRNLGGRDRDGTSLHSSQLPMRP